MRAARRAVPIICLMLLSFGKKNNAMHLFPPEKYFWGPAAYFSGGSKNNFALHCFFLGWIWVGLAWRRLALPYFINGRVKVKG